MLSHLLYALLLSLITVNRKHGLISVLDYDAVEKISIDPSIHHAWIGPWNDPYTLSLSTCTELANQ